MNFVRRSLIHALGFALLAWAAAATAAGEQPGTAASSEAKDAAKGHSHERCELHGGHVTMTKAHHFETLFGPDGVRIYIYSADQNPLPIGKAIGTVTISDKTGAAQEIKLVTNTPKEGEKVVYFCEMNDTPPQMAPGKCSTCGMKLIPQAGLFGAADLSKAEPGNVKAVVHLTGLDGVEKEVTFTEANIAKKADAPKPDPARAQPSDGSKHTH